MNLPKNINLLLLVVCFPMVLFAQKGVTNNAQLANQFLKSGHYLKASELYLELYNTHKSVNYYQGLLDCYLGLSYIDAAEKLIKKHAKKNANSPTNLIDFGHIFSLKGEEQKAQKKFKKNLEVLEQSPHFVATSANRLYKYGYLQEAIKVYKIGLKNPTKVNYHFQLARIYGQLGEIENMYNSYITLISNSTVYLQNVKNALNRTINNDSENENNQLLKGLLIQKIQQENSETISDLLIWIFMQEKNFEAALDQEISLDKKYNLNQKKIFQLARICRKNKAFSVAIDCYQYIINIGTQSPYFLDAQLAILAVNKELLDASATTTHEQWLALETDYVGSLNKLGKTSYTILLLRDLAQIQAFRIHNINTASKSIQEALTISAASPEELAECKLVYADILLLQNEIWDAIIYYSQVDKAYKHDLLGHEAKFRRAKISYYQGDFEWAQAQLNVLKKSTSKLIANDAMELSLLIQDNLNLDTTTVTMEIFSRGDLLIYQHKLEEAYNTLDSIIINYQGHSLVDEALYRQYEIKIMQDKKQDASELLDQIINFFSFDILADDAKFAQAQLQENYFNNTERALELYQDIISNHQDSFFLTESRKRYRKLRGE